MSEKPKSKIITIAILLILVLIAVFVYLQYQPSTTKDVEQSKQSTATVIIAYQTGVDPTKVAQANGDYAQTIDQPIEWRKFDSGADVIAAMASGAVPIGNIGSSPLAAAASQGLDLQVFYIASVLGESEALVVKEGINKPEDLIGKKIAVPFVSTTHYSLLAALKKWGIDPSQLDIINLRPPEILAAWHRGDIDGAYVWEPILGGLKQDGKVLVTSKEVSEWSSPTYDLWVVRKDFAKKNPEFIKKFVIVTAKEFEKYRQNPANYVQNNDNAQKISNLTGSKAEDVAVLLSGNVYPNLTEQVKILKETFSDDVKQTAVFLKSQGKIDRLKDDYSDNVNVEFVTDLVDH